MRKLFSLIAAVLFAGSMMATTVTKTVAELAQEKSFTNAAVCTPFDLDDVISVLTEASDANTGKYYSNGEQIRLYQTGGAKIIFTAAEGHAINSITLTYDSQNTGILLEAESGVAVGFDDVQEATFTVGNSGSATNGQARITSISVTYDGSDTTVVPLTPAEQLQAFINDLTTIREFVAQFAEVIEGVQEVLGDLDNLIRAGNFALSTGNDAAIEAALEAAPAQFQTIIAEVLSKGKEYANVQLDAILAELAENEECQQIIADAKELVDQIYWDDSKSVQENLNAILAQANGILENAMALIDKVLNGPTNCAEAAIAAMSVSENNELYNNGAYYTIEGYVSEIAYAWKNGSMSFWMDDTINGGKILEAYKCAIEKEEDAVRVGDKVAVTGQLTKYNTTPEFAAGCTVVIIERAAPVVVDTYTVAGAPEAIFGSYWDPTDTNNDMVLGDDGLYYWEKKINLTAGTTVEFKIVKNHSWDVASYPESNVTATVEEDGEYLFPIAFQPENQQVFASLERVEAPADPTNCAEAAEAAMSVSENNELYNNGAVYTIEGYVTGIKTAYSDQYHNISFWMADAADGGEVLQAYRAACASEADAPQVGDKVAVTGSLTKYNTTPEFAAGCTFVITEHFTPAEEVVIYDYAAGIGTSILDGAEAAAVKIHTNTDEVQAVKFSSSTNRLAIKPAEGAFKAGDVLSVAIVFNNSDDTKYCMVDLFAADNATRLWRTDSASTINGRTSDADPVVQTYTLEADQDSLLLARYGNTAMFVTLLKVVRSGEVPPVVEDTYTVAGTPEAIFGSFWDPADANNDMVLVDGLYKWEKAELNLEATAIEFKVVKNHSWDNPAYPAQNYVVNIAEAGEYTLTITFDPATEAVAAEAVKKEPVVVRQYEVAEAIAAGLQENDEVLVRGVITKMEIKGKNFAKYGSVNIFVADATGAEGEFEFYNCYSIDADTFRTTAPAYDATSTEVIQLREAADANGNAIHVGDTVIAFGKYQLYNTMHELKTGCYLVDIKSAPVEPIEPDTIVIDIESEVVYVDYVAAQGWWQFMAENDEYEISLSNVSTTQAAGVYGIGDMDYDYTVITIKATGAEVHFVAGELTLTEGEDGSRTIEGAMTGDDGNLYVIKLVFRIPVAENTVDVVIPEWGVYNGAEYYGIESYVFVGEAENGTYVQIAILGENLLGQFTYDDCYSGGTGIEVDGEWANIYSMDINVIEDDEQNIILTADILCLNNTLYHVTTAGSLQNVESIEAAVKAIKRMVNGQLLIEKGGKTFNAAGQLIK